MAVTSGERLVRYDLGRVVEVDAPKGVSWVSFGAIALEGYDTSCLDDEGYFDIVPVTTSELEKAKGQGVAANDLFFAQINIGAISQADVDPHEFTYELPDSEGEFDSRAQF